MFGSVTSLSFGGIWWVVEGRKKVVSGGGRYYFRQAWLGASNLPHVWTAVTARIEHRGGAFIR